MKHFMDEQFLLQNETARKLYHEHAAGQPIFDYHCHLIPQEIAEDKRFGTITDAWLGGDHYKWRAMRTNGIDEALITGKDADPFDKFQAWADTMEHAVGNPLYHWTHLELQRYFGITAILNKKNAKAIYDEANAKLAEDPKLSVSGIMKQFNVYAVGTTDDPADDLAYHKTIAAKKDIPTKVIPSFRPDKALNIDKDGFGEYIERLGKAASIDIQSVADVVKALLSRLDYFISLGCKASDHALVTPPARFKNEVEVQAIFARKLSGGNVNEEETEIFKTYILTALARAYAKKGIVMQLHLASIRDNNSLMFDRLGPDTGFDATHDREIAEKLSLFLDNLAKTDEVPKTVLYSLNPKDYYTLGTLMGCYQGGGIPGKMQLGSAWWFCDHKDGMEQQMKTLGNIGLLPRFIGMLTDSRSFLSYPRHEYFRRILCNLLGTWAENGEVPNDMAMLGTIVEDISFNNAKRYFEG